MDNDMAKYKAEFVSEARDHLDSLNENLLALEKNPEDPEVINKLFRSFHTLKGNSAAMGYSRYSELAHKLEDLLDKVRNRRLSADRNVIDILFEGCDTLEGGLEQIESSNSDEIDASPVIDKVDSLIKEDIVVEEVKIPEKVILSEEQRQLIGQLRSCGSQIWRVIVTFDKINSLKAAKCQVLLRNLQSYRIIKTTPEMTEISTKQWSDFEIILAADDRQRLEKVANSVSGVRKVSVLGIDDSYHGNETYIKESDKHAIVEKHNSEIRTQIKSVKIDIDRLDKLMNMVGELLINKMRLEQLARTYQIGELSKVVKMVGRLTDDVQAEVMEVRMVPIGNIFNRFPRMVRDLAEKEQKKVNLAIEGEDLEFDRSILDELGEPLVHLLRNSVDHGIELPGKRAAAGKDETGTIRLSAIRDRNNALITVSDDGAGIDPVLVRDASIRKGVLTMEEAKKLSDTELRMLIFRPGMSTNTVVTDVSGRGVGMNTVETKIKLLGGSVKLESEVGKGTTIIMKLPLTVSIVTCLLVEAGGIVCAIPLTNVNKTLSLTGEEVKTIEGTPVFNYMEQELVLVSLSEVFGCPGDLKQQKMNVVVVDRGNELVGVKVDRIISQEQILISKLDKLLKNVKGVAGSTILGDGKVGLVLDVGSMF